MPPTPHNQTSRGMQKDGVRFCKLFLTLFSTASITLGLVQCERNSAGGRGADASEGGDLSAKQTERAKRESVTKHPPEKVWPTKQDETELGGKSGGVFAEVEKGWEKIIKEQGNEAFERLVEELRVEVAQKRAKLNEVRAGAFSDAEARKAFADQLTELNLAEKKLARAKAKQLGLETEGENANGRAFEIIRFENDRPVYRSTRNENAAISNAANMVGAGTVYDLTGLGLRAGVWDNSAVRASHQEFGGRATQVDAGGSLSAHQTHVSGTIGAQGVNSSAKGMAVEVEIRNHNWDNDLGEMALEAAAGASDLSYLSVSNHSYGLLFGWEYGNYSGSTGYHFVGDFSMNEDYDFGKYRDDARTIDNICVASPYYLPFWAAGNDRNDGPTNGSTVYYWNGSGWSQTVYDSSIHPDGEVTLQYDTIGGSALAKNVMTVGAVDDAVVGGQRSVSAGTMSSFSGWGPTDDGRIKPDIVANGVDLVSSNAHRDNGYSTFSGTSMATPSVTGAAVLIQERYTQHFGGEFMRASMLKGVIIHTADDLGRVGPDYSNGWGLMNTKAAVDLIDLHYASPSNQHLVTGSLNDASASQSYSLLWDQSSSTMKVTLAWTDPAGDAADLVVDSSNPVLVNDLDIRITTPGGETLQPWVLDKNSPTSLAQTGDNTLDNVEQIIISDPEPGEYLVTLSYKGTLTGGNQVYSLVMTGQDQAAVGVFPGGTVTSQATYGQLAAPSQHLFRVVNSTDDDVQWSVSCDVDWLDLDLVSGTAVAAGQSEVMASLNPQALELPVGNYLATLTFSSPAFEAGYQRFVSLNVSPEVPPSEVFVQGDGFDLQNTQVTYLPTASGYVVFKKPVTAFPVEPTFESELLNHAALSVGGLDDGHWARVFSTPFHFFGQSYGSFNIGTNGFVRFIADAHDYSETVAEHFSTPAVALLWDDLNPSGGGSVYYQDFPGVKVVVTYVEVPEYGSTSGNSMQLELFTDGSGIIRMTYLEVASVDSIVGLSDGQGLPAGWPNSEFDMNQAHGYPELTWSAVGNTLREGDGSTVRITASLAEAPPVAVSFPLNLLGDAEIGDVSGLPESLDFEVFDLEVTLDIEAVDDNMLEFEEIMEIQWKSHPLLGNSSAISFTIFDASYLPDLLAHWKLDETEDLANTQDGTGNGYHGVASASGLTSVIGKNGKARYFDGEEGCFTLPPVGNVGNEVTLSGWVKRDGEQTTGTGLLFYRQGANVQGIQIGAQMDLIYKWDTDEGSAGWSSGLVLPDNTWTFVALVIQPDKAIIYMHDGVSMMSAEHATSHGKGTWSGNGHLGCDPIANRHFKGALDDCRVYLRSLTSKDMQYLYRESLSFVEQYAYDSGVESQSLSADLDPDLDGLPNLLELALATNPNSPDNPIRYEYVGGKIKIAFERMNEGVVIVEGEWSTDMVNWHTAGFTVTEEGLEIPMDTVSKFVRLKATEVEP